MLPRPSRLKSLASELSPVFTTPPPVEPKTVFVLMSVPEIMLSSNLVGLRLRAAIIAAIPPSTTNAPPPTTQVGVLPNNSSMSETSVAFLDGTADFGTVALGSGGGTALVSGALVSSTVVSGALASGGGMTTGGTTVVVPDGAAAVVVPGAGVSVVVPDGGVAVVVTGGGAVVGVETVVPGDGAAVVAAGGVVVGGVTAATCVSGALGASAVVPFPASAFVWRSDIVWLLSAAAFCRSRTVFSSSATRAFASRKALSLATKSSLLAAAVPLPGSRDTLTRSLPPNAAAA